MLLSLQLTVKCNTGNGYSEANSASQNSTTQSPQIEPANPVNQIAASNQKMFRVFFKSLRKTSTKESIVAALSQFGQIRFLHLPFNKTKNRVIGYGYVVYQDQSIGKRLVNEVKQVEIDGRLISLTKYATSFDSEARPNNPDIPCPKADPSEQAFKKATIKKHKTDSSQENQKRVRKLSEANYLSYEASCLHSIKPTQVAFSSLQKNLPQLQHDSSNLTFWVSPVATSQFPNYL